ncbi:MAG: hypothetical protein KA384_05060 [Leptotrichiaceae bacterium]|nr:hypothetical protein [Leptotrichiaceae bacterium]
MKIRDIVNLREFDPVVDLSWATDINEQERMLSNYIMTESLAERFVDILESLNLVRSEARRNEKSGDIDSSATKRSHIISGFYGTGKSYFLLMLNVILSMENKRLTDMMIEKFSNFPELKYQLEVIKDRKKYFVVRVNGESENEKEFKNVIQETVISALEKHFGEINIETLYTQMLKILDTVYEKNSSGVENYLKDKEFDFYDLKGGLSNYQKHFLREAEELLHSVQGVKPKLEIDKLDSFIKNVNKILEDNGYDELIIIFDEFSAYITASMENGRIGTDLGQIQALAQLSSKTVRDSQNIKVALIASTHKDLLEMIGKSGTSKKDEVDKVLGRFEGHILNFDQGEALLKNTIDVSGWEFYRVIPNHSDFVLHLEKKYGRNFKDFYPLHPATVNYLEPISSLYAQKTRTTFGFLKEVVKEIFFNKEIEKDGKLNLVTLSDLFDHFESSIDSKHPGIIDVFNQNYSVLKQDETLIDFLKALTIAHSSSFTKSSVHTELSAEDLKDVYQISNEEIVREKLNPVVNNNHLNITTNDGKYRLFVNSSGINLDKLISENKDRIVPYTKLMEILKKSSSRIFIRDYYELKYNTGLYPFEREMNGKIVTLNKLETEDFSKLTQVNHDASITFLIPEFNEQYDKDSIIEKYKETMRELSNNICLAVPNSLMFDPEELREYGAMQIIEKEHEEIIKNDELKKILIKRRRKLEDKIRNKYLRKFANLRNFTFVFSNGRVKDDIRQDLVLYKEIFYNYFTKFPHEITVENFNDRAPITAIDKIFINGGIGEIAKNDTSVGSKQVYNTLMPLGLISSKEKAGKFEFSFKMPTEAESQLSKEIMDLIQAPEVEWTLEKKIKKLISAPYGLNKPLIMLYILVATRIGTLTVLEKIEKKNEKSADRKPVMIDSKNLGDIVDKPEKYEVQKNSSGDSFSKELKEVWMKLNELKIVQSSKSRAFRIDGRNDFGVFNVLGSELQTICKNLSDKETRLEKKDVVTGKLKSFVNKLNAAIKSIRPEELYNSVEKLPTIFRKSSFEENMEEFDKFITNLKTMTEREVHKVENTVNLIEKLHYVIKDLPEFPDMKDELIYLEDNLSKYREEFCNIDLLNKIEGRAKEVLMSYNSKFKNCHDLYYAKFFQKKNQLLEKEGLKLESLKALSELKIPSIALISDLIEEIELVKECNVTIEEDKVAQCRICKYNDLKKIEQASRVIDENFNSFHRKIVGMFVAYEEKLRQQEVKEHFANNQDYKKLVFALGRITSDNLQGNELMNIKESIKKIKEDMNDFLKGIDKEPSLKEKIELVDLENGLKFELQALGKNYVSLEEIEDKFNKLIKELKEKNIRLAKI